MDDRDDPGHDGVGCVPKVLKKIALPWGVVSCLILAVSIALAADSTFFVYRDASSPDNHGFWTNVIPAGAGLRVELAAPSDRGTAVRLDFDLARAPWSGIVVASAPGYWGAEAGPGFDLAGARALVFRARGENGGERIRVKAAVAGDQPFGDTASLPLDSGWLTLGSDWREFRIDAAGRDLSRLITPLLVMANDKHNPGGRITVFLDDIRYERGG